MRNYNMQGLQERPCGCIQEPSCMRPEYPVGMAYVPWQDLNTVYEPDRALEVGTIFPELDKPWLWRRGTGKC